VSVTDFWRRWHMSLSRWFRDYVYIPLGGNRGSSLVTYRNLFTVFFLTGIWHGAAWTFVVWGLFHGVLLAFERATGLARVSDDTWQWPRRALTFLLVVVGWVFFRAADMGRALEMLRLMFVPRFGEVPAEVTTVLTDQRTLVFVLGMLVVLMPRDLVMGKVVDESRTRIAGAHGSPTPRSVRRTPRCSSPPAPSARSCTSSSRPEHAEEHRERAGPQPSGRSGSRRRLDARWRRGPGHRGRPRQHDPVAAARAGRRWLVQVVGWVFLFTAARRTSPGSGRPRSRTAG
jgi:hypothetical protein